MAITTMERNLQGVFSSGSTTKTTTAKVQTTTGLLLDGLTSGANAVSSAMSSLNRLSYIGSMYATNDIRNELETAWGDAKKSIKDNTLRYLDEKSRRLEELWNTKIPVTLESLLGETAAFSMDMHDIGNSIEKKLSNVLSYLLGVNSNDTLSAVASEVGQGYIDALTSDGSLSSIASSLSIVQGVASGFNSIVSIYDTISNAKKAYELISKGLSIGTNFAISWTSGGVSVVEASNTIALEAQKKISEAEALILYSLKKLIFPIKVKVPSLLVGAVDRISVRDAMIDSNPDYALLFDSEFYRSLEYSTQWSNSIEAANRALKEVMKNSKAFAQNTTALASLYKGEVTKEYMREVLATVRKTVGAYSRWGSYVPATRLNLSKEVSTTPEENNLDYILSNDLSLSPINSAESLIGISKTILNKSK